VKVWLVTVGEPLPVDGDNPRLMRTGILSGLLAAGGHEVLWWTSAFDHVRKRHRCPGDAETAAFGYRIRMLHGGGYRKNVSVARFLDHREVARKFRRFAGSEPRPDIILCSLPTVELCVEAVRYGGREHVPVVLDVRDLWPDLIAELAPRWGRPAMRLLLAPLFRDVREACSQATALFGLTGEFLDWGLNYAGRGRSGLDRVFPMGYTAIPPAKEEVEEASRRWEGAGISRDDFNICFFGAIGLQSDFGTVIEAARILSGGRRRIRFVLCGIGEKLEHCRRKAAGCPGVLFPGWVNRAEIHSLMRISSAGLVAFRNKRNYTLNLPNKPIEYLSAGLPIVSSLTGVLQGLLARNRCGVTYEEGNPESLAEAVVRLYDDREELRLMARNAKALYEGSYQAERIYGEMAGHLQHIAEERKR